MEYKYSSKTSLFLLELIIAILFFSIASAICVQLFVKSHFISDNTRNANQAVLWTQNITEVFYNQNGNWDSLKQFFQNTIITSPDDNYSFLPSNMNSFIFAFDKNWNTSSSVDSSKYIVYCSFSQNDQFHILNIYMFDCSVFSSDAHFATIDELMNYTSDYSVWHYATEILDYQQKGDLL